MLYQTILSAIAVLAAVSTTAADVDKLFPRGGTSIDLSACQYQKALGASERLSPDAFSMLANNRFLAKGDAWQVVGNVKFSIGKAELAVGSELMGTAIFPVLKTRMPFEMQTDLTGTGAVEISIDVFDAEGKALRPTKKRQFKLSGSAQTLRDQVWAFEGAAKITLKVKQLSGSSILTRADVVRTGDMEWVAARCIPAAITDNVFAVMENNPTPISFQLRNTNPKRKAPAFVDLVLALPDGFSLKPGVKVKKISEEVIPGGKRMRFRQEHPACPPQYIPHDTIALLIGTNKPADEKTYSLTYHLEYAGVRTLDYPLSLKVIPGFSGMSPKLFLSGFMPSQECAFRFGSGMDEFADSVVRLGFNKVVNDTHSNWYDYSKAFQKRNLFRSTLDYWFQNGYCLGSGKIPDSAKFIGKDGKPLMFNSWHNNLCPTAGYTRSETFNQYVIDYLGDKIMKHDFGTYVMGNWEPIAYDDKGCFCVRCRAEFVRYSKLPEETVRKAWPNDMTGKYRKIWVKFRSWQHAKLIGAILDGFRELSKKHGKEFILVPEVAIGDLNGESRFYDQYTVRDYIDKLDWLEPWGPYIFHNATAPYKYNIGVNIGTYYAAGEAKELIRELCKNGKTPKIEAFPHGFQVSTWVTEPEAMAYETAAFFVKGWEASSLYVFPAGLDGRYWRAAGEINNAIAHVEDFVFKGKRRVDLSMSPATPLPQVMAVYDANNPVLANRVDKIRKMSIVTLDAFELDGSVMLALGNAWQRGEAFVKVRIPGLNPAKKYTICVPDKKVALASDYTAKELADGVLLHVGAFRYCFYVVSPAKTKDNVQTIGKYALAQLLEKRLPDIRKVYSEDRAYAAEFVDSVTYDFGQNPSLTAGNINLRPKHTLSDSTLNIAAPHYHCELAMGKGGTLTNLTVNGQTLIDAKSAFFSDAFAAPEPAILRGAYEFRGWEATDKGAVATLVCRVGARDSNVLKGLVITKQYTFGEKEIRLGIEIRNSSAKPVTFNYRSHNIPSLVDMQGKISDGKGGPVLQRISSPVFHPAPGFDGTFFGGSRGVEWKTCEALFTGKGIPLHMQWQIPGMTGIYRWDAAKSPISSFEIIAAKYTLTKDQKLVMTFSLNF